MKKIHIIITLISIIPQLAIADTETYIIPTILSFLFDMEVWLASCLNLIMIMMGIYIGILLAYAINNRQPVNLFSALFLSCLLISTGTGAMYATVGYEFGFLNTDGSYIYSKGTSS